MILKSLYAVNVNTFASVNNRKKHQIPTSEILLRRENMSISNLKFIWDLYVLLSIVDKKLNNMSGYPKYFNWDVNIVINFHFFSRLRSPFTFFSVQLYRDALSKLGTYLKRDYLLLHVMNMKVELIKNCPIYINKTIYTYL